MSDLRGRKSLWKHQKSANDRSISVPISHMEGDVKSSLFVIIIAQCSLDYILRDRNCYVELLRSLAHQFLKDLTNLSLHRLHAFGHTY